MATRELGTVALLSDPHGVLPVLEAVLAEPEVRAADHVVVTGDLVSGPMPTETLDALTSLGERAVLVRGNADREVVEAARGGDCPHPESAFAAQVLGASRLEVLAALPHPVLASVAGFGEVAFCHGSPRDEDEVVLVDTRPARWAEAFAELPESVRTVCCGHTHMPFVRLVDRRLVVNPGSIGMPYGRVGGSWALLAGGQVSLRHTEVDVDAVCERIVAESQYRDARAWVDEYVRGLHSDLDALAAFGPRDGRSDP